MSKAKELIVSFSEKNENLDKALKDLAVKEASSFRSSLSNSFNKNIVSKFKLNTKDNISMSGSEAETRWDQFLDIMSDVLKDEFDF